jgi:hypothetical protein
MAIAPLPFSVWPARRDGADEQVPSPYTFLFHNNIGLRLLDEAARKAPV